MKVSIITACFNSEKTIEDTIRSVAMQTYKNIEYIVVDGASTDETLNIINKYGSVITKLISEPDTGVYNAMNKGIQASTGDLLFFLNADDVFINEHVVQQFAEFALNTQTGLILGNIVALDRINGRVFHVTQEYVDKFKLINAFLCHPAMFFKKELFDKYGLYNEKYKIVSDYEWYVKYFVKFEGDFAYLNKPVSIFDMSGVSSEEKNKEFHQKERDEVLEKYFTSFELKTVKLMAKIFPRKINKFKFRKKLPFNKFYKRTDYENS